MSATILTSVAVAVIGQPSFVGLGAPPPGAGFPNSRAAGISATGVFVAGTETATIIPSGFVWMWHGGRTLLPPVPSVPPEEQWVEVFGISPDGLTVLGHANLPPFGAMRWSAAGGYQDLGDLDAERPQAATASSSDGSIIVGFFGDVPSGTRTGAFRWSQADGLVRLEPAGSASSAADISADGSRIVGFRTTPKGMEACLWRSGEPTLDLGDLPGGASRSESHAISADGSTIVGEAAVEAGTEGFVWTDADGMLGLGDLPGGGFGSRALDVSADGSVVVGGSSGVHGPDSPFVWTRATGMISLVDLLTDAGIDLSDWILAAAVGVSADGRTIVGNGVRRSTGVPEAWIAIIDPPCPADFDGDHALTPADFTAFRSAFLAGDAAADVDDDGDLTAADFSAFRAVFLAGCP